MVTDVETAIVDAFEQRNNITPGQSSLQLFRTVDEVIQQLDRGELRVAEPTHNGWEVNEWVKKAVLLYLRMHINQVMDDGVTNYFDKVPPKFADWREEHLNQSGVRVVPPATARRGSYIAPGVVLMPSYVNIGAYVDEGTMVDTWATVGSCAQIGRKVHLSGGVGIGGVLEPLQANPTIIEDECFIGARSEIAEGVIVGRGAVISMGVFIGQSTKIYDRTTGEIHYGRVPEGAVVVPGSIPADDGSHNLYCAVIIKYADERTRAKVGINELLRP